MAGVTDLVNIRSKPSSGGELDEEQVQKTKNTDFMCVWWPEGLY